MINFLMKTCDVRLNLFIVLWNKIILPTFEGPYSLFNVKFLLYLEFTVQSTIFILFIFYLCGRKDV